MLKDDKSAFVKRVSIVDVEHVLPSVSLWNGQKLDVDIFICAQGFEDRAKALPCHFTEYFDLNDTSRKRTALVCRYPNNEEDNDQNLDAIFNGLSISSMLVRETPASVPREVQLSLLQVIDQHRHETRKVKVVFDISAASSTLILSVFKALIEVRSAVSLHVLYSEPAEYFPSLELYKTDSQSLVRAACDSGNEQSIAEFGVSEVEDNELYPGNRVANRAEHLIAVPGFRTNRLVRCLSHVSDQVLASPNVDVYWILGEPPSEELKWRHEFQARIVDHQLALLVGMETTDPIAPRLTPDNHTTCSTRDYQHIFKALLEHIDKKSHSNLSIVHMGSKLQAVGVALALAARSEVAVCSARPKQFNPKLYTKGVGSKWCVNFSNLDEVVAQIRMIGGLRFEPKIETTLESKPSV
jgi:hypothetical protein